MPVCGGHRVGSWEKDEEQGSAPNPRLSRPIPSEKSSDLRWSGCYSQPVPRPSQAIFCSVAALGDLQPVGHTPQPQGPHCLPSTHPSPRAMGGSKTSQVTPHPVELPTQPPHVPPTASPIPL